MPTTKWFEENPKVSAYVPVALHQKLEAWMETNGVKKVSQALTQILEDHLRVDYSKLNQPTTDISRLEALEGK